MAGRLEGCTLERPGWRSILSLVALQMGMPSALHFGRSFASQPLGLLSAPQSQPAWTWHHDRPILCWQIETRAHAHQQTARVDTVRAALRQAPQQRWRRTSTVVPEAGRVVVMAFEMCYMAILQLRQAHVTAAALVHSPAAEAAMGAMGARHGETHEPDPSRSHCQPF